MGRYCTGGYKGRATYDKSAEGKAYGNKEVYCIGGNVLCSIFLGVLLECISTNTRDWGSMAT